MALVSRVNSVLPYDNLSYDDRPYDDRPCASAENRLKPRADRSSERRFHGFIPVAAAPCRALGALIRFCAALPLAVAALQASAQAPAAPAADAAKPAAAPNAAIPEKRLELGPNEEKVGKYIVIEAPIRDRQDDYVRQGVEQFVGDTKKQGKWGVLLFEIPYGDTG